MWPWEHVVVGYLAYSVFCRLGYRDTPGGAGAFVVVVASVLPDLIDKPLAWSLEIVETGYAVGHSMFFAGPLVVGVWIACRLRGWRRVGAAFGLGYLLHLPGDLLYLIVVNDSFTPGIMLWPVASVETAGHSHGVVRETIVRLGQFKMDFLAGELSLYIRVQLVLTGLVAVLWVFDGAPVLQEVLEATRRQLQPES